MGSDEHVCPDCGQPVDTVVRRHKTLGTWVPRWVAGPCRNPECGSYEAAAPESGHPADDGRGGAAPATSGESTPDAPRAAPGDTVAKNS
ncbi:hypothetical protein [Streptomyces sp. NRRL B-1140]|uniref:hypothetical protein n=1 Tax=Streptomyces sp. NRRL B-1140 TaxID=1415549 RepID=UPI0006AE6259|nr:hypothetical protein [Streptomyces sp. NRRL B-1140]